MVLGRGGEFILATWFAVVILMSFSVAGVDKIYGEMGRVCLSWMLSRPHRELDEGE
jgi:hypothetical protein